MEKGGKNMGCFSILEENEGIEDQVLARLARLGLGAGNCLASSHPALLVLSPRAARNTWQLSMRCRTLLLPGDAPTQRWNLQAASAVSYGCGHRDTLTLSSREGPVLWAALQREVVTVQGHVVDRQEFPLNCPPGQSPLVSLAVAGTLLLMGAPPESLGPS